MFFPLKVSSRIEIGRWWEQARSDHWFHPACALWYEFERQPTGLVNTPDWWLPQAEIFKRRSNL